MPKITKRLVESLSPERSGTQSVRDVFAWDDELKGFGVQVKPSGWRAYVVQYRRKSDGRSRRLTIGPHCRITAEQAREQAKILLGEVALGSDPLGERQAVREQALLASERERNTVVKVFAEFLDRHAKARTRSWRETQRLFEKEVLPYWGTREIGTVTRHDVIRLLDTVMDRGAPYTANRVLAAVRKLFSWCMERGILDASPRPEAGCRNRT